jgi:hypothetical protein
MRRALSDDELRAARMRAQSLAGPRAGDVVAAVARVGAVQAQSPAPARLAVRARTTGQAARDVDRACADRALVCTWAMRGTLHLVPAADVRWLVDLLGPVFAKAGRRRREALGLDASTCERALRAIETVLRDTAPLTRAALIERLADEGVHAGPGQAPAHLLMYAAMRGLICRGVDTTGPASRAEPTYVLLDEWVTGGDRLGRDEALAELARRYLTGHGPAGVRDFLAWSGLPAADGKAAFELISAETEEVEAAGTVLSALPSDGPARGGVGDRGPRLLGHFDPLLLGYRGRGLILDPAREKRIQAGGGFVRPAVVVGDRVAGTWSLHRTGGTAEIVLEPFDALPEHAEDGLRAEAEDIGRYLDLTVRFGVTYVTSVT